MVSIFSGLLNRTKKSLPTVSSEKESLSITERFFTYDDVPLLMYIDIAKTHNYNKLIKVGSPSKLECIEVWEQIVTRSCKATGSFDYMHYIETLRTYGLLIARYNIIKACLFKLTIVIGDPESMEYVTGEGYDINVSSTKAYMESIALAFTRSNALTTRILSKRKELDGYMTSESKDETTIEESMAYMSSNLGFNIETNITLARFNEYKKIIRKRQWKQK